jgi:hypothetical protein
MTVNSRPTPQVLTPSARLPQKKIVKLCYDRHQLRVCLLTSRLTRFHVEVSFTEARETRLPPCICLCPFINLLPPPLSHDRLRSTALYLSLADFGLSPIYISHSRICYSIFQRCNHTRSNHTRFSVSDHSFSCQEHCRYLSQHTLSVSNYLSSLLSDTLTYCQFDERSHTLSPNPPQGKKNRHQTSVIYNVSSKQHELARCSHWNQQS